MNDRFILKIDPPQSCLGSDENDQPCPRLTEYAEAEAMDTEHPHQLMLAPYCWQHLEMCIAPWQTDPTAEEVELEQFCITRFVAGYYGGQGTATVLGPCPLDSVPPPYKEETEKDYEDEEEQAFFRRYHASDQAYYVTHRSAHGQERQVCAIWRSDYLVWELYEFPTAQARDTGHRQTTVEQGSRFPADFGYGNRNAFPKP